MRQIDVIDAPDQTLSLIGGGRRMTLRLRHNATEDRWALDLAVDGAWVLYGRKLVPDVDVIAGYGFGIGGLVATDEGPGEPVTYDALVTGSANLFYIEPDELP